MKKDDCIFMRKNLNNKASIIVSIKEKINKLIIKNIK